MPLVSLDHFTVLTRDAIATAEFYSFVLGLEHGFQPSLPIPVIWLYNDGKPILHIIERDEIPDGTGVLDHMAFRATGLPELISRLAERKVAYDLRRVPEGGANAGVWQLFFQDPNGARIEVDLDASEAAPQAAS